jgi:dihydrofolate reductase
VTDADAFFPRFDADQWTITHRHPHPADAKHAFSFEFVDYVR